MADTRKSIDLNEISKGSEVERMLAELEGGVARASQAAAEAAWADRFIAVGTKPASRPTSGPSGWAQRFIAADGKVQSRTGGDSRRWATRFIASSIKTAR